MPTSTWRKTRLRKTHNWYTTDPQKDIHIKGDLRGKADFRNYGEEKSLLTVMETTQNNSNMTIPFAFKGKYCISQTNTMKRLPPHKDKVKIAGILIL